VTIRAVLFDLDNTLWRPETTPDWEYITRLQSEAVAGLFERMDMGHLDRLRLIPDFWERFGAMRKDEDDRLEEVYEQLGATALCSTLQDDGCFCSGEDAQVILEALNTVPLREFNVRLLPDAERTLGVLAATGLSLGVVSNRPMTAVQLRSNLLDLGLPDVFGAILTSLDFGYRKPHPSIFQAALEALDTEAREAAFVGDMLEIDVLPALALGMTAIHKTDATLDGGHISIRGLSELPDLLVHHL